MAKHSSQISGSGDHVLWSFSWELSVSHLNDSVPNVKEYICLFLLCGSESKSFPGYPNPAVTWSISRYQFILPSSGLLYSHTEETLGTASPQRCCCTAHCPLHQLCPPLPRTPAACKPPCQIAHHVPALPALLRDSPSPLQGCLKLLTNTKHLKEWLVVLGIGCVDRVLDNNWLYLVITTFGEFSPFLLLGFLAPLGKKKIAFCSPPTPEKNPKNPAFLLHWSCLNFSRHTWLFRHGSCFKRR